MGNKNELNKVSSTVTDGKTYQVKVDNDNADVTPSGSTDKGPIGEVNGASYYKSVFII